MPKITLLPHAKLCPNGLTFEAESGASLCKVCLQHHVLLEHACEMSGACGTCHVLIREGFSSLIPADDAEEDVLDKAWGVTPYSRLACRVTIGDEPLVIEIPLYSLNLVKE